MRHLTILVCLMLAAIRPSTAEPVTIHCPTEPPVVRRLDLQETWRIDPDDPDAPLIGISFPSQVVVHDGRVFMLDAQLCHVLVYSDRGEYLDTILGEGDGPGEVRSPGMMMLLENGRLAVQHGYPTKLEFVDLDGTPRGRWQIAANTWVGRLQQTAEGWFGVYQESHDSGEPGVFESTVHVALHDDGGRRTSEFFSETTKGRAGQRVKKDEAKEYRPWSTAVAVGGGQIVCAARRDAYRLEWRDLAGDVTRVVTRDVEAHRRTEAELEELKYRSYSIIHDDLQFDERDLCSHDPVIQTIDPLADGALRVDTSRFAKDLPEGMVCPYEVHEPDGRLRERVEIFDPSGDYDTAYDAIALLPDGRAMVLRNVMPASRLATEGWMHPKLLEKLPPIPDDRDDVAFAPVMCRLVAHQ